MKGIPVLFVSALALSLGVVFYDSNGVPDAKAPTKPARAPHNPLPIAEPHSETGVGELYALACNNQGLMTIARPGKLLNKPLYRNLDADIAGQTAPAGMEVMPDYSANPDSHSLFEGATVSHPILKGIHYSSADLPAAWEANATPGVACGQWY